MKHLILIIIVILIILFIGFKFFSNEDSNKDSSFTDSSSKTYPLNSINNLNHTTLFLPGAIKHIFIGKINSNGLAEGFHYANLKDSNSYIIGNSESSPNQYGVYKAKVTINGTIKSDDGGYSTFFPNSLSPQEIINYINTAYSNKHHIHNNIYIGKASDGMEIEMYLTEDNKIISAFPKY